MDLRELLALLIEYEMGAKVNVCVRKDDFDTGETEEVVGNIVGIKFYEDSNIIEIEAEE